MYCNICGHKEIIFKMFKINICNACFKEISNISFMDKDYERYKNMIRIILGYYIEPRKNMDNLVF